MAANWSVELRVTVTAEVGLTFFNDWGMVWATPEDISEVPPQPTFGVGVRYRTPIGPLRLDLGWRIPLGLGRVKQEEYRFWDQRHLGLHFALTEAF